MPKILHIGMPKTGSTSLQKNFFSIQNVASNIGKPFPKKKKYKYEYDFPTDSNLILSDEDISIPYEYKKTIGCLANRNEIFKVVSEKINPDIIVVFLREQSDLLNSWYLYQYSRGRVKSKSFSEFWMGELLDKESLIEYLNYEEMDKSLKLFFPYSKIKYFSYNAFKHDNNIFFSWFNSVFEVDLMFEKRVENLRVKENREIFMFHRIKHLLGLRFSNFLRYKFGRSVDLKGIEKKLENEIKRMYKVSNENFKKKNELNF